MASHPMVHEFILRAVREGLMLVILLSAPPLLASMLVGLVTGILQAATQIHEQTLTFVPRVLVVGVVLLTIGPVFGGPFLRFAQALLMAIPGLR